MTDIPEQPATSGDRVGSLEVDMLDVKVNLNRLIDAFYQNDSRTTTAIERLAESQLQCMQRTETLFESVLSRIDEMQSEVRGLQTENRRILEVLQRNQE
jgi:predicted ATPase